MMDGVQKKSFRIEKLIVIKSRGGELHIISNSSFKLVNSNKSVGRITFKTVTFDTQKILCSQFSQLAL